MNDRLAAAGAWPICIGLLLLVLGSEFLPQRQPTLAPTLRRAPARTAAAPAPRHPGDDTRVVLARPLFSVHRRPAKDAARASSAQPADLPRLSGIVIAAATRRAIFDEDGKVLTGSIGDHVGPYAIMAIAPRQVTVSGPAGVQTLALRFGAAQPAAPPMSGPGILDRLRSQVFRPPALPSSVAMRELLLRQQTRPPQGAPP